MVNDEENQDEEELMTGRRKTADERVRDKEERDAFRMQLLQSPEFPAFMERWYAFHQDDPYKYTEGKFEDAWKQHCLALQFGVTDALANQSSDSDSRKLSAGKWDSIKQTWVTDDTLIRSKQDSEKSVQTAGHWNRDSQQFETDRPIEPESKTGLTCGKWDPEKKRWIR